MEVKEGLQIMAMAGLISFGALVSFFPIQNTTILVMVVGGLLAYLGIDTANKIASNSESA